MTEEIIDGLLDFVDSVVVPLEERNMALLSNARLTYDERGAYSAEVRGLKREVRSRSSQAGYYNMFVPESTGGGGFGAYTLYRVWHALHRRYGPGRILPYASVAHWSYGPSALCAQFSIEVAERDLPSLISGETSCCFGMSEPDAGSDAWAMRTRAVRTESGWEITGTKQWITNSPTADYIFVFAVTDEDLRKTRKSGVSCFFLPMTTPGIAVDSVIKLFGRIGGEEGIVSFRGVQAPASALVGQLNEGFRLAMTGVNAGRMYNAGRCIGFAQWALDKAAEYASQRKTFGKEIAQYQGVSFQLADSAIEIYAADCMARDCGKRLDRGEPSADEVAMVKVYSTELCTRVIDRCMQVHGGMGLTNEVKLYDAWHQGRIVRIADGSAEIMRRNIATSLVRR